MCSPQKGEKDRKNSNMGNVKINYIGMTWTESLEITTTNKKNNTFKTDKYQIAEDNMSHDCLSVNLSSKQR